MCLLIVQKNNAKVSNKNLKNAWERNNDGVGYSFVKDGKIVTRKYMQFKPFKTSFNNDVKKYGNESAFLIHFRYATHGATDLTNVHPFNVSDDVVKIKLKEAIKSIDKFCGVSQKSKNINVRLKFLELALIRRSK